jgi:hypothetical protein
MSEIRRALGDGSIETVVGRGYRFLLHVEAEHLSAPLPKQVEARAAPLKIVGRSEELEALRQAFDGVFDQKRHLLFVAGEPGIGKTALIDVFLAEVAAPQGALIAAGSCVEQFGLGGGRRVGHADALRFAT